MRSVKIDQNEEAVSCVTIYDTSLSQCMKIAEKFSLKN